MTDPSPAHQQIEAAIQASDPSPAGTPILYFYFLRSPIWHVFGGGQSTLCNRDVRPPMNVGDAAVSATRPSPMEKTLCPECKDEIIASDYPPEYKGWLGDE